MWKLIRVLEATLKGPWRGSQRPTVLRPHSDQAGTTSAGNHHDFSPDGPAHREDQGLSCKQQVGGSGPPARSS